MDNAYQITLLNKAIAKALIMAQGFTAGNMRQQAMGVPIHYDLDDFAALVDEMEVTFKKELGDNDGRHA